MTSRKPHFPERLEELPQDITQLLEKWGGGDREALGELISHLYNHLHKEAGRHLNKLWVKGDTLQATALVNEAYLKLGKKNRISFLNREQFFWFASQMMRHIIVDHIRARTAAKRHSDKIPLEEDVHQMVPERLTPGALDPTTFLAINEAISDLETINPRRCQIVTLRFVMGATIRETASIMALSITTVKDEWAAAKLWLFKRLTNAFQL